QTHTQAATTTPVLPLTARLSDRFTSRSASRGRRSVDGSGKSPGGTRATPGVDEFVSSSTYAGGGITDLEVKRTQWDEASQVSVKSTNVFDNEGAMRPETDDADTDESEAEA
ncbi:unnamed protein product, partial [Sphacelaria rigidula]